MCIQCNAFDAIWTNYIVNEHQVSPAHHLYTKWKFIVPFTLLPFEMLAQMSTRTHTHTTHRRHHHQPPSYHSPHNIPHTPLTINKSNDMLLPIFVTVPFIWCILNERICACVSMRLCVCIECQANAKVQNDLDSFYLHCYSNDLFVYCIRTMASERSSKSKLIT